ncbi:MAG: hypothetical protein R3F14_03345 [Polyangiaceae bacterium]
MEAGGRASLALLPRHLELQPALPGSTRPRVDPARRPVARNWLALWFSLEVLRSLGAKASPTIAKRCALHADLAYVLREAAVRVLRRAGDYFFQPSTYAAALRRLVEHHTHEIIGLPRDYNIVRLLEEIGEQDGLNRYVAAEHLQHVLEVYVAGHFPLSAKIEVASPEDEVSAARRACRGSASPRRSAPRAARPIPRAPAASRRRTASPRSSTTSAPAFLRDSIRTTASTGTIPRSRPACRRSATA